MFKKVVHHLKIYWLKRKGMVFYAKSIGVQVRENCRIYSINFGSEPWLISIGNNVAISSQVSIQLMKVQHG